MKQKKVCLDGLNVLIAPDAFKGSLDSVGVAQSMARGLLMSWPNVHVDLCPMTDGGEGAIRALSFCDEGRLMPVKVSGPYGDIIDAYYWMGDDGVAIIEMAQASGISLSAERDPMRASSYGTGELIAAAAAQDPKAIWVACGGSATVDGGLGALQALGWSCLDAQGGSVAPGGQGLCDLVEIRPPVHALKAPVSVLCDVTNPLLGKDGCIPIYGPQKGLRLDQFSTFENGLASLAERLSALGGKSAIYAAGGGAAGGLGFTLMSALRAEPRAGFDTLAQRMGLARRLACCQLVLTGEGRLDAQTPYGKTISGIWDLASEQALPVWAFAGEVTAEAQVWCPQGMAMIPVIGGPCTLGDAMQHAASNIERAVQRTAALASTAVLFSSSSS